MKHANILTKGFITRLVLLILLVFIIFSSISGLFLYFNMYKPLDANYGATISTITEVKETLLIKTIKINAVFYLFVFIGIMILGILYTHRIAGPLYRIKLSARLIAEGNLTTVLKFRKKDAIHSFGDELNKMTENCRERFSTLTSDIQQLKNAVNELKSLKEKGDIEPIMKKISNIDERIKNSFKEIRQ